MACLRVSPTLFRFTNILSTRCASTNSKLHKIVLTDDESTFVAWHPKQDFPYECTRPLPEPKLDDDKSILKSQLTPELYSVLNKKSPDLARLELMKITHTTKHRWFPRSRDRKAKKTPMDREFL